MRIIAGKNRSRIILMVGIDSTRETTDKVRGAIFNLITSYQIEGYGLDLFSGSGAMGLEALSRGLDFCYFNDINKKAYSVTKKNIADLKYEDQSTVFNLDYKEALKRINHKLSFVFLDPPYALDVCGEISSYLVDNDLLTDDGLIILEVNKDSLITVSDKLEVYKRRNYGIRDVIIYRRVKND